MIVKWSVTVIPGGDYNKAFDAAIKKAGGYGKVSPETVRSIAEKLMKEFF